jgi:hypothetical protein
VGVLHVHSRYSDGAGDLGTISRAASRAGLDFFVLTDHNRLDALRREGEGYTDGVLRLVGAEISTEGGHFLALDIPEPDFRFGSIAGEALQDVAELGGFSVVAHPDSDRPEFSWADWELPGYGGVELVNLDSAWRRGGWYQILRVPSFLLNPRSAVAPLLRWDPRALPSWDRLLAERRLAGWVGADAHGRIPIYRDHSIPWPRYEDLFRVARNHLVLAEPLELRLPHDRELIWEALRRGRGYVSLDGLADGSRFAFFAERGGETWPMGSVIAFEPAGAELRLLALVEGPPGTRLRLLRNGSPLRESDQGRVELAVHEAGVYRAEAWLDPRFVPGRREQPWIVSNPLYVLEPQELWRRAENESRFPPAPDAAGLSCQPLGEGWPVDFHAEQDPASTMDAEAARSATGSFRIDFQLAEPSSERPYVWCAVADRSARSLAGFRAVRFRVKADGVYRVSFQLRDEHPGASEEATEWWAATFKTGAAAGREKEILIPFSELRSISLSSDGQLDLERIRGIFFVLDAGNTRPGARGSIAIEGVSFCR